MLQEELYLCAFDPVSWKLGSALSFPDRLTAEGAYQFACRGLKEYDFLTRPRRRSVNRFMFCLVSVARSGSISIPLEKDWFWWFLGYWRGWYASKDLHGKARTDVIFDREEFERTESLTKEILCKIESTSIQYLAPDIFVMRKVCLALQPTTIIKPVESQKQPIDYSSSFRWAANGVGMPKTAVGVAYDESIEWADEPANVKIKNKEPIAVRDDAVLDALNANTKALKENTAVNKKGFQSLKSVNHQSLAELVKKMPPLRQEREDENWVSSDTVANHAGEPKNTLKQQRRRGKRILFENFEYGRDTEGRIWCRVTEGRKVFYLKESLSGLYR